ncbi:methyltransferase [Methanocella paludicola SANAE]|uniref:Methyltransferase n=1 Tax=Methanocella paludicola (strain DSM 17711 / JCM 13418 / NBRC 101707 / SANAE) TaxID=304371 RepID=D1YX02_METPS|nr:methyltransferase domain-containing protein [Methanocella paludicola]BAI60974.1 methyltransferase [Methanocella paludicola SANAE]
MSSAAWDGQELAELYDRISDLQYESGRRLVEKMQVKKGDNVLDVGCGTGRLAFYIVGTVGPLGSVTGIDLSPHRIKVAEAKLNEKKYPNVCLMVGRGEDLSQFPDESFDRVCYSSVFHWVDDKKAAAEEAYRVLKHGGNIGITTVDKSHPFAMRKVFEKLFSEEPYAGKVDLMAQMSMLVDRNQLEQLLYDARFRRIDVDYIDKTVRYSSAEELINLMEASSFGNFLRDVPEELRARAREDMKKAMESMRTGKYIELPSKTMFVIASKPSL